MKKFLLTTVLFNLFVYCFSQDWIRYYGYGSQPYASYCIEQYDKGYILLGDINNYKFSWIVKTDINGNKLWDIKIGDGINEIMPANIEQTQDNGFILCGTTTIYSSPSHDPFIMKLNSCGDVEWCKVLNYDEAYNGSYGVKQTKDGGYVLLTLFQNDLNDRIRMFKFDSGGELFWAKTYNHDSLTIDEMPRDLYVDTNNFLISGSCYYPEWLKPYYIQTDTSGNETWRLAYSQHTGLGYVGDVFASVRDKHGNYYSAGFREGSPEMLKVSGNGFEMMNVDLYPTSLSGNAVTILLFNDTTLIIGAGWTLNGTDFELAMLKTDTLGVVLKQKDLPNPDNSGMVWSAKTFDNKVVVVGTDFNGAISRIVLFKFNSDLEYDSVYTRPFTYDSLCPDTIVSHTIMPDCDVITGLNEPFSDPETASLKVFPNPASQKVTIEMPEYLLIEKGAGGVSSSTVYHKWKSTTLEVYNLSGKKVFEKEIIRAQSSIDIDVSKWPGGMYYFRLMYNKQVVAGEKVIIQ